MNGDSKPVMSFTTRFGSITNTLINSAIIRSNDLELQGATTLWDTGATCTCISKRAARDLNLIPTGKKSINTVAGETTVDTYLVTIILPNNIRFTDVMVCCTDIESQGIDLLIGMDIIQRGDIAVTNFDGNTAFTFRIPSCGDIDFEKQ